MADIDLNGGMPPAQPSSTLWGDMFGLGPLMRLATDPMVMQQALAVMQTLADGGATSRRIEAKLDFLMRQGGHDADLERINREAAAVAAARSVSLAGFPLIDGAPGASGPPAASRPAHDGSGAASPATDLVRPGGGDADAAGNG